MLTRPKVQTAIFFVLAIALIFPKLGEKHLANFDDCLYAQKSKEMVETGEWLVPHFAGRAAFDNPPLYLWLTAGMFKIFGRSNFTAIFVSAFSGVLCIVLIYRIGLRLGGRATAFCAATILLTTQYFTKYARHAMFDVFLTLLFLVAIYAYLRAREDRPSWFLLLGIACGMGVLTKSVLGLFPLAVVALHLLWAGPRRMLASPWFLGGCVTAMAVFLPWYLYVHSLYGEQFLAVHLKWLLWERAFVLGRENQSPFSKLGYLIDLGRLYWPWVPLALVGMGLEVRRALRDQDEVARLTLLWFVVVVGTMSLANERKLWYVMSVFPCLALMGARVLAPWLEPERRFRAASRVVFGIGGVAALVLWFTPVELSRARQPGLHAIALEAERLVPEGGKVLNWRGDYYGRGLLFLYYSGHELTRPIMERETYEARLAGGEWGIMTRAEHERDFRKGPEIVAEAGDWVLIRDRPASNLP